MGEDERSAAENIENLTTADMLDYVYGQIQSLIERGSPDNVEFHYFLPPIPFGPELASIMRLGTRPQKIDDEDEDGEERFNLNDMRRAAVNFAVMVDYIPETGSNLSDVSDNDENESLVVDLNSLVSSGKTISNVYNSVLQNCKVVNSKLSEEDEKRLQKYRAALYKEPPEPDENADDDELLDSMDDDDDDPDLDALLGEDVDAGDFVEDPDSLAEPTRVMQLYRALESRYQQERANALDQLAKISPNDPNAGERTRLLQQKIRSAERRWEAQGKKTQVETIMNRIAQLSRSGMVDYLQDLIHRFESNKLTASLQASEEGGVGVVTEDAYYTALRPNGILDASTMMRIELNSSQFQRWSSFSSSNTSGSARGIIPSIPLFGRASGQKVSREFEREFLSKSFSIEFEIVQGIIDRPWFDLAFLESRAYTTAEWDSNESLDPMMDIVQLSDGEQPPSGAMPLVPVSAYFVRNLKVHTQMSSSLLESERDRISGRGGISILGFGASGRHTSRTTKSNVSRAQTGGTIEMEGLFLIGFASRYLENAPDPDFERWPNREDWI